MYTKACTRVCVSARGIRLKPCLLTVECKLQKSSSPKRVPQASQRGLAPAPVPGPVLESARESSTSPALADRSTHTTMGNISAEQMHQLHRLIMGVGVCMLLLFVLILWGIIGL